MDTDTDTIMSTILHWVALGFCCRVAVTGMSSVKKDKTQAGEGKGHFASPVMVGGGLDNYCVQTRQLFLHTSASSGVMKALLLDRNRQLSCNPK